MGTTPCCDGNTMLSKKQTRDTLASHDAMGVSNKFECPTCYHDFDDVEDWGTVCESLLSGKYVSPVRETVKDALVKSTNLICKGFRPSSVISHFSNKSNIGFVELKSLLIRLFATMVKPRGADKDKGSIIGGDVIGASIGGIVGPLGAGAGAYIGSTISPDGDDSSDATLGRVAGSSIGSLVGGVAGGALTGNAFGALAGSSLGAGAGTYIGKKITTEDFGKSDDSKSSDKDEEKSSKIKVVNTSTDTKDLHKSSSDYISVDEKNFDARLKNVEASLANADPKMAKFALNIIDKARSCNCVSNLSDESRGGILSSLERIAKELTNVYSHMMEDTSGTIEESSIVKGIDQEAKELSTVEVKDGVKTFRDVEYTRPDDNSIVATVVETQITDPSQFDDGNTDAYRSIIWGRE